MDNLQLEFPEFDPITFTDAYEENGQGLAEVIVCLNKFFFLFFFLKPL